MKKRNIPMLSMDEFKNNWNIYKINALIAWLSQWGIDKPSYREALFLKITNWAPLTKSTFEKASYRNISSFFPIFSFYAFFFFHIIGIDKYNFKCIHAENDILSQSFTCNVLTKIILNNCFEFFAKWFRTWKLLYQ